MTNPSIEFIDRGDTALSGQRIAIGVTLTADSSDQNQYSIKFEKVATSTSHRNIKSNLIPFDGLIDSGTTYTATASIYIAAVDDKDNDELGIVAKLYKNGQDTGIATSITITFIDLNIQHIADIISVVQSIATPSTAGATSFTQTQCNQIKVDLTSYVAKFTATQKIGIDLSFTPLSNETASVWSDPGDTSATPATIAKAATRIGSNFILILSTAGLAASLYITSTGSFTTQAVATIPLQPYLIFVEVDQQYVEYIAPQPVNLIGDTVTVPPTQSAVYFNIDPDALTVTGDLRLFWMVLNGTKIVIDPVLALNMTPLISVPVVKLNTTSNTSTNQNNRLQYFVESQSSGIVRSSEYGFTFNIVSQYQNQPDPNQTTRPFAKPYLSPSPNGGIQDLIDENYITTNDGASGEFFDPGAQVTMNIYINGWDEDGNPQGTTLHPAATLIGNKYKFKINYDDLIGYSVQPVSYAFSTMKIEYYISDKNSPNYNVYSKIAIYKLDTVSP